MILSSIHHPKIPLLIAAVLFLLQLKTGIHLNKKFPLPQPPEEDTSYKINPQLFKIISFGHLPVAIDWLWMKILMDPRTTRLGPNKHPAIYYQIDLLTDLDPEGEHHYYAGSNLLAVLRKDGIGAEEILKKGMHYLKEKLPRMPDQFKENFWPFPWRIPLISAYVYTFELDNLPKAAEAFRLAAQYPNAPLYLKNLESRLSNPGGIYEVGLKLLNTMIKLETNPQIKTELEAKRPSLYLGQYLFEVQNAFENFLNLQNSYKKSIQLQDQQMQRYWHQFLKETHTSPKDPLGGKLYLDSNGKVNSTTAFSPVFNISH